MIVLDTHVLLWILEDSPRLSRAARAAVREVEEAGRKPIASGESLYEIARGMLRGRIQSTLMVDELLAFIERRFTIRSLTPEVAIVAAQLPDTFPSDPFDRIIAATAIVEKMPLLTADLRIRESRAVRTVW